MSILQLRCMFSCSLSLSSLPSSLSHLYTMFGETHVCHFQGQHRCGSLPSTFYKQGSLVHCRGCQESCCGGSLGFSALHLTSHCRSSGIADAWHHAQLCVGSGESELRSIKPLGHLPNQWAISPTHEKFLILTPGMQGAIADCNYH